jgi:hypothetical protein
MFVNHNNKHFNSFFPNIHVWSSVMESVEHLREEISKMTQQTEEVKGSVVQLQKEWEEVQNQIHNLSTEKQVSFCFSLSLLWSRSMTDLLLFLIARSCIGVK